MKRGTATNPIVVELKLKTIGQAERNQMKLYDKFHSVKLVKSPMFSEEGTYVWHCRHDEK